jgi:CorA-like Mg2+ transporter protein
MSGSRLGPPILAAPTAIAGIYGKNFEHMPELKWAYGYYLVIGQRTPRPLSAAAQTPAG